MEIPGHFLYLHVCKSARIVEHDCSTLLKPAQKRSVPSEPSLCLYPTRQADFQLTKSSWIPATSNQTDSSAPVRVQGERGTAALPRIPRPPSPSARQLHYRTFLCIMHSNLVSTPSPSLSLVCVWAKEDESLLELNEGYIYANFKE